MKKQPFSDDKNAIRVIQETPIGPIAIEAGAAGLVRVMIVTADDAAMIEEKSGEPAAREIAEKAVRELRLYFSGKLKKFTVPVDLSKLTAFQGAVLEETARIPFGDVFTYGEVALRIDRPKSARAVGGALARNPVAIVIPCHRVVAQSGKLHGFSSPDGIATKAKLLRHEHVHIENEKVIRN